MKNNKRVNSFIPGFYTTFYATTVVTIFWKFTVFQGRCDPQEVK